MGLADDAVSVLTQAYTISNLDESNSIDFILLRQADLDLMWDADQDFTDDVVGTATNANPPGGSDSASNRANAER